MTHVVQVKVHHNSGHTIVTVHGRIFSDTVDPLHAALTSLLDVDQPRIVLDLSEVEICDSSGLNLLADSHHAAISQGGWLRLAGLQPIVRRVVEVTNLDRQLSIHATVDDAIHGQSPQTRPYGR